MEKTGENVKMGEGDDAVEEQETGKHPLEEMPSFEEHMETGETTENTEAAATEAETEEEAEEEEEPEVEEIEELLDEQDEVLAGIDPKASDEMREILGQIGQNYSGTKEIVFARSAEETKMSLKKLKQFRQELSSEMREKGNQELANRIGEMLIRNYDGKVMTDDFVKELARGTNLAAESDWQKSRMLTDAVIDGVRGFAKNECDGDLFGDYLDFAIELAADGRHITAYESRLSVLRGYVRGHGYTKDTTSGFRNIIFPSIEENVDGLKDVIDGCNALGTADYEYGIADYTEECLLSRYTPQNIDKLNRIYHEIPTSDYRKFEQNRQDASRIQYVIIGGRDFIHDERLGVHEILATMEEYYDAEDAETREEVRERLIELDKEYPYARFLKNALELENYDKPVEKMGDMWLNREMVGKTEGQAGERAIDILRRLVKNTTPEEIKPPETQYADLNRRMQEIEPVVNAKTGAVRVSLDKVGAAVTEMNGILVEKQGEQGISPNIITAVAFLDKMASNALRGFDKKDLTEAVYDPNFKEILRFSQLTASTGYDEAEFERFYRRACEKFSEAYGGGNYESAADEIDTTEGGFGEAYDKNKGDGVDIEGIREGWRLIGQRVLKNTSDLARNYGARKATKRFVDATWSGNLEHELIGMFDRV